MRMMLKRLHNALNILLLIAMLGSLLPPAQIARAASQPAGTLQADGSLWSRANRLGWDAAGPLRRSSDENVGRQSIGPRNGVSPSQVEGDGSAPQTYGLSFDFGKQIEEDKTDGLETKAVETATKATTESHDIIYPLLSSVEMLGWANREDRSINSDDGQSPERADLARPTQQQTGDTWTLDKNIQDCKTE